MIRMSLLVIFVVGLSLPVFATLFDDEKNAPIDYCNNAEFKALLIVMEDQQLIQKMQDLQSMIAGEENGLVFDEFIDTWFMTEQHFNLQVQDIPVCSMNTYMGDLMQTILLEGGIYLQVISSGQSSVVADFYQERVMDTIDEFFEAIDPYTGSL